MAKFVVSALKYRPVRFDEVVGQEHVSRTLKNALQTDHLAHAFLFCGPRGVGKTTCARILAKVLNCHNPTADFEPCNTCGSCEAFNGNASFNITELDAASNNSVEHIRALIEQVRFAPQQGKYKVFIIDEVHMLSQAAFNAFLKTLEEPPEYAIFILATTEKHKIIPTILSRCQIFDFKRIQPTDVVDHLLGICTQEEITADPDALHIIGQKADGALRDALSIFDRIVSFAGKKISYEDVISNLNVLDYDYYFRVFDALLTGDRSETLLIFDDILSKGFDAELFINGLAEHARNLLVCRDPATLALLETGDKLRSRYHEQSQLAPADFLLTVINLANDCDLHYKQARNKRLHVELFLLKMASIPRAFQLAAGQLQPTPVASAEKKTPAANAVAVPASPSAPAEPPAPAAADPAPTEPAKEIPSVAVADPDPSPAPALAPEAATAAPPPPPSARPKKMRKMATVDPAALLREVTKEAALTEESVERIQLADLQAAWAEFTEAHNKLTSQLSLRTAVLAVERLAVQVRVPSERNKTGVLVTEGLVEYLREQLKAPQLTMHVTVDPSLKPKETKPKKKILTPKEKFLAMRAENPALEDLRKRFDLRPDE
jgi:DNA polymerase-3 subunit gamma/tau